MKKISLIVSLFVVPLLVSAAELNAPAVRLNLRLDNVSLSEALKQITERTGIHFSYNPEQINADEKVSLSSRDKEIEQVLQEMLPPSVETKYRGKYVILLPAQERKLEQKSFPAYQPESIDRIKEENKPLKIRNEIEKLEKIPVPDNGIPTLSCHNNVILKNEKEMKEHLTALAISLAAMTTAAPALAQESENGQSKTVYQGESPALSGETKPFQFSLIYPLSTDWIHSAENSYGVSLNLIGGVTGRADGLELGSAFNMNKYGARGVQLAGAFNFAGFDFSRKEESNVFQAAGGFNYASAGSAVQLAGGFNVAQSGTFQASGGFNVAEQSFCQLSGGFNVAKQGSFQAAGGINIAEKASVQLAGGVNIAKESETQIAPVNITKKGGFQLGVVNVRDTADGFSLGVLNIIRKGGMCDFGLETGDMVHTALTFRSGTHQFYTIFSAGINYTNLLWTSGFGMGTSFKFNNWLGLNLELMHHYFYIREEIEKRNDYNGLVQFRPLLDFRIARRFKAFAGPVANLMMQTYYNSENGYKNISTPYKALFSVEKGGTKFDAWLGFTAGVRF